MKIKCVKCPVGKEPEEIEIENSLEALQEQVGGYIEVLPLQPGIVIVCNEEGKLKGLEPNRGITWNHKRYDVIYGDFLICQVEEPEFVTMPKWTAAKWAAAFHHPNSTVEVGT